MAIIIKANSDVTAEENRRLDNISDLAYGEDDSNLAWTDEQDWRVWLEIDGEIVSFLTIIQREARVGETPVRLGGVGGVATHPAHQRKGYAAQVMSAAGAFMHDTLHVDFGHLLCSPELLPYYARFGWQPVEGPLLVDQPGGKISLDHIHMILPCASEHWPAGTLDLCGLPW